MRVMSSRLTQADLGKIHLDFRGVVEIVREDVQRHVGDDFRDFAIRKAGAANGLDVGIACKAKSVAEMREGQASVADAN